MSKKGNHSFINSPANLPRMAPMINRGAKTPQGTPASAMEMMVMMNLMTKRDAKGESPPAFSRASAEQ